MRWILFFCFKTIFQIMQGIQLKSWGLYYLLLLPTTSYDYSTATTNTSTTTTNNNHCCYFSYSFPGDDIKHFPTPRNTFVFWTFWSWNTRSLKDSMLLDLCECWIQCMAYVLKTYPVLEMLPSTVSNSGHIRRLWFLAALSGEHLNISHHKYTFTWVFPKIGVGPQNGWWK